MVLIGAPSAGKTPALRPMIEVSRVLERDAEPAWRETLMRHERDAEAARAHDKAWRDTVRTAATDGTTLPERPANAEPPAPPARPRIVAMDTSTEELQRLLAENPRGLLYVRDELVGWLGGFDRYGMRGADRAFYVETWNVVCMCATVCAITMCPCASSTHRSLSSAVWFRIACARYWPMPMMGSPRGPFISGLTRRRSCRSLTAAMQTPPIGATCSSLPHIGCTGLRWAPTMKAHRRRAR
jgi:hypothetical protein